MMGWSDAQLAATVFHELAHQVVYVPGDSEFNEAFATVVEEAGIDRWLQANGRTNEIVAWRKQRERYGDFIALLLQTRERLNQLYTSALPEQQKRWRKHEEFGRLKYEYTLLKQRWGGYAGYDAWFDRALNNALLVSAATYHSCTPGLEQLLASADGDLRKFYSEVRKVAEQSAEVRRARLCVGSVAVPETAP
jgi:predicted aminopeptidase